MSYDGGVQDRRVPLSRIKLKKTHTTPYDVADHLYTPQQIAEYLDACFEEADCDAAFIAKAIGDVVILPFLTEIGSRVHAAMANRCFGVIPPKAMFGRS